MLRMLDDGKVINTDKVNYIELVKFLDFSNSRLDFILEIKLDGYTNQITRTFNLPNLSAGRRVLFSNYLEEKEEAIKETLLNFIFKLHTSETITASFDWDAIKLIVDDICDELKNIGKEVKVK